MKPEKGSIAICGIGTLGLITEDSPLEIEYPDGNKGVAYVGIHLTDKVCPIGSRWSSKNPLVICHTKDIEDAANFFRTHPDCNTVVITKK
jgi:hypothetical protein